MYKLEFVISISFMKYYHPSSVRECWDGTRTVYFILLPGYINMIDGLDKYTCKLEFVISISFIK